MQNKYRFIIISFIFFICCFNSANAIEVVPAKPDTVKVVEEDGSVKRFKTFSQIAFGLSTRTDENKLINPFPMVHVKYYYQLSDKLATKFGLGYSTSNKFKSNMYEIIKYRNAMLETGFRWNIFSKDITFYHENGFAYNYYMNPQTSYWEHRIGMNFSFGINFKIQKELILDIAFGQTFNDGSFQSTKNINPSVSPIGIKDGNFFNEMFNPAAVQVLLFKRL